MVRLLPPIITTFLVPVALPLPASALRVPSPVVLVVSLLAGVLTARLGVLSRAVLVPVGGFPVFEVLPHLLLNALLRLV